VEVLCIAPGAPWENGYAETFHSRLRDELLNAEEFANLLEARVLARDWQDDYNHERPECEFVSAQRRCHLQVRRRGMEAWLFRDD
jgi:Integrase core domain